MSAMSEDEAAAAADSSNTVPVFIRDLTGNQVTYLHSYSH